jgi:hypothetical protein
VTKSSRTITLSPSVRRGRVFYLILATLIVADRLLAIVLALVASNGNFNPWRSLLFPVMVMGGVILLWQGDKWLRWGVAVWSLLHGAGNLLIIGYVVYSMASVTPPEGTGFFRTTTALLFGIPLLHAGFYIFAGLALLLSRSLKLFFDLQSLTAENPFAALKDWLLSFVGRDRAASTEGDFMSNYENRERYPVLEREKLAALDDFDLVDAVVDYMQLKIDGDHEHAFEIVSNLPLGFRAVYSTWWVQAEVNNGGFHQYFYNWGVNWAFMALEGYKLFGAQELAALMARAIDVYLQEEPEQLQHRTADLTRMLAQYAKARELSTLPELDSLFYEVQDTIGAAEYIRNHLDEFVTDENGLELDEGEKR